jgi:hypothetical protein
VSGRGSGGGTEPGIVQLDEALAPRFGSKAERAVSAARRRALVDVLLLAPGPLTSDEAGERATVPNAGLYLAHLRRLGFVDKAGTVRRRGALATRWVLTERGRHIAS